MLSNKGSSDRPSESAVRDKSECDRGESGESSSYPLAPLCHQFPAAWGEEETETNEVSSLLQTEAVAEVTSLMRLVLTKNGRNDENTTWKNKKTNVYSSHIKERCDAKQQRLRRSLSRPRRLPDSVPAVI